MNYLAHSFLSSNQEGLLIGNFIADHIKGQIPENYPLEIMEGIHLHRQIDSFTDSHPLFKDSKRVFYDKFEKYSGILVDFYFDHLLGSKFEMYSSINLQDYCDSVYKIYTNNSQYLPESSKQFLNYVLNHNAFFNYSKQEGIEKILTHFSHRINHKIALNESLPVFIENRDLLENNFNTFMNDAMNKFLNNKNN
ncbi:MAG: DUF479 domain-containing protein [Sphingobacteriaceae bacterium]|nr:DUF479 domain-containing protein [Sphingobacteriaceae bacterium]